MTPEEIKKICLICKNLEQGTEEEKFLKKEVYNALLNYSNFLKKEKNSKKNLAIALSYSNEELNKYLYILLPLLTYDDLCVFVKTLNSDSLSTSNFEFLLRFIQRQNYVFDDRKLEQKMQYFLRKKKKENI